MNQREALQKSQCTFVVHLLVHIVFLISWLCFGTMLWYAYTYENDYGFKIWLLVAFEFSLASQATVVISILYAIYWLHETGEIIKRVRKRIADGIDEEIEALID